MKKDVKKTFCTDVVTVTEGGVSRHYEVGLTREDGILTGIELIQDRRRESVDICKAAVRLRKYGTTPNAVRL